jgi:YidC/Oxa1 family membrane protein insertase
MPQRSRSLIGSDLCAEAPCRVSTRVAGLAVRRRAVAYALAVLACLPPSIAAWSVDAAPVCRPGARAVVLETARARWAFSPCGAGAESIKLLSPQFQMTEARPPSGALPGWAKSKWAAGPLELVGTWDAKWDPFQERVLVRPPRAFEVAVAAPEQASPTTRSFADLDEMAVELPHWYVAHADADSIDLVWPDPERVRSPIYLRKQLRRDPNHPSMLQAHVEVWWLGAESVQFSLEHVLSGYRDPAAEDGGLLAMLAGPPDIPGAGWYADGQTQHLDVNALLDADPEERVLAALPQWISTDTRYFLLALLPGQGFGKSSSARLVALGNGVLQATLRGPGEALGSATGGCVPAFYARRWGGSSCEEDFERLGLEQPPSASIDPALIEQALLKRPAEERSALAPVVQRIRRRQVHRVSMKLFAGSKEIESLRAAGANLDESIDFGWFGVIARPLLFVLKLAQDVTGSWPLAILILTILVKGLLWPVMGKSMRNMRKMAALKPELEKIRADLTAEAKKRGESTADPSELNKRTFALYQSHGVNPLGGCLPVFLQMPVYIALYRTISSSVELFNQPLFGWIRDLTQHDPYYVLPIVLGGLMVLQQRITPTTTTDESQRKMMMYIMPVMFSLLMMSLPSGLTLYILTNTVLSIGQTWWLQRNET